MDEKIYQTVTDFINASLYGDIETVKKCLHKHVIFMAPDFETQIKGIDACVQSIISYNEQASTKNFELNKATITQDYRDKFVVADYVVTYKLQEEIFTEHAKELFVLTNDDNQWKIIWRALLQSEGV